MSTADPRRHDEGGEHARLEETFRRLARAPHASEDFHETVMARAAMLPSPRKAWRYRLFNPECQSCCACRADRPWYASVCCSAA